jgi:signal transduction histidine kinase
VRFQRPRGRADVTPWFIRLVAAVLALGAHGLADAAVINNPLSGYSVTSWSKSDGLPIGQVWSLAQDADGYIWVGVDAGLLRFDGVRFLTWDAISSDPLPRASVREVLVSRDGSLWIGFGEAGGVARIGRGTVRSYGDADGLRGGTVSMLKEDSNGTIWLGNDHGLYRLANDRWNQQQPETGIPPGAVTGGNIDQRGVLMVAAAAAVFRHAGDRFQRIATLDYDVLSISADSLGRVYITDPIDGFRSLRDQKDSTPERWKAQQSLRDPRRGFRLLNDHDGNLWIWTAGLGLWRVPSGHRPPPTAMQAGTTVAGLLADGGRALLEDREGNIWAGTWQGLNRLTPHKVKQIPNLGIVIAVEAMPDGTVWAATEDSLIRFVQVNGEWHQERRGLGTDPIRAMHLDEQGSMWVATNRHIVRFAEGRFSSTPEPITSVLHQVSSLASDLRGRLWIYDIEQGLVRWHEGQLERLKLPSAPGQSKVIAIHTDRDSRLWISFDHGQLGLIDAGGDMRLFGPSDGLDAGVYRTLFQDVDGVIWFGGNNGVSRFKEGRFSTVRKTDNFPFESLTAIVKADSNSLWLGGRTGIARISRDDLEAIVNDSSRKVQYFLYDMTDGVAGNLSWFGNRSGVRTHDGTLWFLTGRGITIVNPRKLEAGQASAPVRIERVIVDDRKLDAMAGAQLPKGTSRLEIDYTTLNLTSPFKTSFRYRLEGFDTNWIEAGARRQAFYTNLPPRGYRFRVIANNDEGTSANNAASWEFSILPRFYQTAWFAVLCASLVVLTGGAMWRLRLWQVRKEYALLLGERVRLSREIHDTLLQSLVGVAMQLDVLAHDLVGSKDSAGRLLRMRKQVEDYIREARHSIWNLRSSMLEKHDLVTALRNVGDRATDGTAIAFELDVAGTPQRRSARSEEQLLRIAQEAVANAVRHARTVSKIRMELRYEADQITLRVSDDGEGFDLDSPSHANGHCGLKSMRERAESIRGTLHIATAAGCGTAVEAVLPQPGQLA